MGETTLVFDLAQDELRQMKLDFRILRDVGETPAEGAAAGRSDRGLSAAGNISQGDVQLRP